MVLEIVEALLHNQYDELLEAMIVSCPNMPLCSLLHYYNDLATDLCIIIATILLDPRNSPASHCFSA